MINRMANMAPMGTIHSNVVMQYMKPNATIFEQDGKTEVKDKLPIYQTIFGKLGSKKASEKAKMEMNEQKEWCFGISWDDFVEKENQKRTTPGDLARMVVSMPKELDDE